MDDYGPLSININKNFLNRNCQANLVLCDAQNNELIKIVKIIRIITPKIKTILIKIIIINPFLGTAERLLIWSEFIKL